MPSWVSTLGKSPATSWEDHPAARAEDHGRGRGGPPRGGNFRGRDERGAGAPGGRREGGGGGDYRRGGPPRGRDDDFRDQRPRPTPLPDGITASTEPEERALETLVHHVRVTKHAFSIFDAAKLLLGDGSRFKVKLVAEEGKPGLWRVPQDSSVWRSKDEAIAHVLGSPVIEKFYRAEEVEREAPRGNFQAIAVCGFSGTLLGPPNHHSYQAAVIRTHREKFANLPIETYRRRIRTEHDPALVEKWLESQRTAIQWVWLKDPALPKPERTRETKPETAAAEEPTPAGIPEPTDQAEQTEIADPTEPSDLSDPPEQSEPTETEEQLPPAAEESPVAVKGLVLASRQEMEAHFRANHVDRVIKEARHAYLPGNVEPSLVNPDLMRLVRVTVDIARSKPFAMTQRLCGSFERKGMKIFKRRGGKLFVCATRPKALAADVALSDGIRKLVDMVKAKQGITVPQLLAELAPLGDDGELTAERRQAMQDLHWLADEGYLIEYSDGVVTLGVQGEQAKAKPEKSEPAVEPAVEPADRSDLPA